MEKTYRKSNFVHLTIALVFLLLVSALVDQFPTSLGQLLVQASTIITVAAGIGSTNISRTWFRTGTGFLLAILVVAMLGIWLEYAKFDYLHLLILISFYLWATWLAAKQVLFTGPIEIGRASCRERV